jgi:uncharacterized protein (DUF983 family)
VATNPYGSLDPRRGSPEPVELYPGVGTLSVLARGVRKRCPRCAERSTFDGWFTMRPRCPRCDLRFEREEGGFLGAMTLNYAVAIGVWLVVLAIVVALTVPDVPVVPLLAISAVILILVPLWFYPRSRMLWAAVEFLVHRSDPDYRAPVVRDPRARDLE